MIGFSALGCEFSGTMLLCQGEGWLIREYATLEGLELLSAVVTS